MEFFLTFWGTLTSLNLWSAIILSGTAIYICSVDKKEKEVETNDGPKRAVFKSAFRKRVFVLVIVGLFDLFAAFHTDNENAILADRNKGLSDTTNKIKILADSISNLVNLQLKLYARIVSQGDTIHGQSDTIILLERENANLFTGGNSIPILIMDSVFEPAIEGQTMEEPVEKITTILQNSGKYPLSGIRLDYSIKMRYEGEPVELPEVNLAEHSSIPIRKFVINEMPLTGEWITILKFTVAYKSIEYQCKALISYTLELPQLRPTHYPIQIIYILKDTTYTSLKKFKSALLKEVVQMK